MGDAIYISHQHIIFSKGEKTMNWDNLLFVWDEILAFFDKTFQWTLRHNYLTIERRLHYGLGYDGRPLSCINQNFRQLHQFLIQHFQQIRIIDKKSLPFREAFLYLSAAYKSLLKRYPIALLFISVIHIDIIDNVYDS